MPKPGRIQAISTRIVTPIVTNWQLCSTAPDAASTPEDLVLAEWQEVVGRVGTVAAALRDAGQWSVDSPIRRFDGEDWWWRVRFAAPATTGGELEETYLCFDGLATIADVWCNGNLVISSDNMHVAHRVPVALLADNEIVVRFRALDRALSKRRPRPRWRVPMIENQQLRWYRTTLLGRTPGWSPPAAAVGPWRGVRLEQEHQVTVDDLSISTRVEHEEGIVEVSCELRGLGNTEISRIELWLEHDAELHHCCLQRLPTSSSPNAFGGRLNIPHVALWWPHTHGPPALYSARLAIVGGSTSVEVALGRVGFRTIVLSTRDGQCVLGVNGVRVFCRGACWTPLDAVTLVSDRAALAAALDQVVASGMNMLRVSGTMVYESDDFYDLCDECGVLLWHDLMFANMDYPEESSFLTSVTTEVLQFLNRMQARPSLAVLCGSSEGEQQAAMWGATRECWTAPLFHEILPALCRRVLPDVPYWPSSAHGGSFPHQASAGSTSYYGVGAYLRPLDDSRRAEVRFASECLAFANIPDSTGLPGDSNTPLRVHHAAWKARTPRDLGAGWDFDDVRDHYLEQLFRVDPVTLRYSNYDRYLPMSRAVTGEVMAAVFGEWRRQRSTCGGGLIWFLRDLWPSAGWGVIDASGRPKAAWWYLRRALAPVALHISDEGVNGLAIHIANDRSHVVRGELELASFRSGEVRTCLATCTVEVPARAVLEIPATDLLDGFVDLSFAYRFGPPPADLVVVTLRSNETSNVQAYHFPLGLPNRLELDLGLTAEANVGPKGDAQLHLRTRRFAQALTVEVEGYCVEDSWFHMAPGSERILRLTREQGKHRLQGIVQALNCETPTKIVVVT